MNRTILTLVVVLALTAAYGVAQTSGTMSSSSSQSTTTSMPSSQSSSTTTPANSDNQQILSQIQQQLSADPGLRGVQATIDDKNVVTLQGTVSSKADRKRAKSLASAIPGVKRVQDNVTVSAAAMPSNAGASTPASATQNNAGSIAGNTSASAGTTSGSASTVGNSGTTSAMSQSCPGGSCGTSASDKSSMSSAAAGGSAEHQSDIQHAISQQITNSNIIVQQTPNNIVLTGTVSTEADRTRAESIAKQYAAGATVVNQINVSTSSPMAPPSSSSSSGSTMPSTPSSSMTTTATEQSSTTSTTSTSSSGDMQTQIQTALQQQGLSGVVANVTDTSIDLTGTVSNSKDRTTAKRIAQSYAGNRKVTDHLTVSGSASPSSSMGTTGASPSPNNSGPGNTPNPNAGSNSTTKPPDQNNPH